MDKKRKIIAVVAACFIIISIAVIIINVKSENRESGYVTDKLNLKKSGYS